ncbi:pyridoxamine 5'-phosphate oxidase family protein [Lentzea sp. NPDC051213]|uniref:pyridoxamine 5'-phosphate oxidase family protein n=1 Tax=Lentzea sp. NPDC051213 TaxID=3364126 RepID=UPI0037A47562
MTNWSKFVEEAPVLAAAAQERIRDLHIAYLATTAPNGAPRVHPVSPIITEQGIFVFMEPSSPKGHDLRRGGRFALHPPVDAPIPTVSQVFLAGRGRVIEDPEEREAVLQAAPYDVLDRMVLFELDVDNVMSTSPGDPDPYEVVREFWPPR